MFVLIPHFYNLTKQKTQRMYSIYSKIFVSIENISILQIKNKHSLDIHIFSNEDDLFNVHNNNNYTCTSSNN